MAKLTKDANLLNGKGEDESEWITVNGSHISIKENESVPDAIEKRFSRDAEPKTIPKQTTFTEQIDKVLSGDFTQSHLTISEETPKILQDIGVPNKPLMITAKHTYLAINKEGEFKGEGDHYHDLGKKLFEKLPDLLKSPILVFKNNDSKNDIVAVINAMDKKGNPVIVPIHINGQGKQNFIQVETNIVKSVYGRKNFNNYLERNITNDNLLIFENKKIRDLNLKD